jgi:integrase
VRQKKTAGRRQNAPGPAPEVFAPMQEQRIPGSPRRIRLRGKPGIYYRTVTIRDGERGRQVRRYEISYLDSDGRRRWQAIPGHDNLDDAHATLTQINHKLHRGERVAPSRQTFDQLADQWLSQLRVSERTRERYDSNLRNHLRPRYGQRRAQAITIDDVARLILELEQKGKKAWTIRNTLTTMSSLMSWAKRRGLVANNPVADLDARERPRVSRKQQRAFEPAEIKALLAACEDKYRPLIATALFSGLRLMELLALRWQDINLKQSEIHVRSQLRRKGGLKDLKTDAGRRDVVLMPELARLLRRHKAGSRYSQEHDYVFASETGTPLNWRNVEHRGFDHAIKQAKLARADGKPVLHDCRHTFASLLIAQGLDIVFISRQLGHANPATTLRIYAHLFDKRSHATRMRDALSRSYGNLFTTVVCAQIGEFPN